MRTIAALILLTGCFGTPRAIPDAAPDAQPPPPTAGGSGEPADTTVEDAAPTDADVPLAEIDAAVAERLPAEVVTAIRRAKGRFDSAKTSADVAAAWRASNALAPKLEEALYPAYEATGDPTALDLSWLIPSLPGMSETYMAEGTALVFVLDETPWKALAEATPEPGDDAFFALMERTWGSARPMGWPAWSARTWDYGGCSALGHGVVVEVLVLADAAHAAGSEFHPEIAETRSLAIGHILEDDELFPRCNPNSLEPTSTAALHDEVDRILSQVTLSADERSKIEARKPKLAGQEHTGG